MQFALGFGDRRQRVVTKTVDMFHEEARMTGSSRSISGMVRKSENPFIAFKQITYSQRWTMLKIRQKSCFSITDLKKSQLVVSTNLPGNSEGLDMK